MQPPQGFFGDIDHVASRAGRWREIAGICREAVLGLLYPPHCMLCRAPLEADGDGLCGDCWVDLGVIDGPCCNRCGCPGIHEPNTCENCREKVFAFSWMQTLAAFQPGMQDLVHRLKYGGGTRVARVLGNALGFQLGLMTRPENVELVMPVPLHGSRQRERGYNQSGLIAREVGRRLGVRVEEWVLRRVRATPSQTALDLTGRAANVSGAFEVRKQETVAGRWVLLIDDVVTTGATANSCTEALLEAGAKGVCVAALASPYFEDVTPG